MCGTNLLPHSRDLISNCLPGPFHGMHSDAIGGRPRPLFSPGSIDRVDIIEEGHQHFPRRLRMERRDNRLGREIGEINN